MPNMFGALNVGEVANLLKNEKTREQLREEQNGAMGAAEIIAGEPGWEGDELATGGAPSSSEAVRFSFEDCERNIRDILQKRVIEKLSRPSIITCDDLYGEFHACLRVSPEYFDIAYQLFIGNIQARILAVRAARPFAIGELTTFAVFKDEQLNPIAKAPNAGAVGVSDTEDALWIGNDIRFDTVGPSPADLDPDCPIAPEAWHPAQFVFVRLSGLISERALSVLRSEMSRVVPSLVRTVSILEPKCLGNEPTTHLSWCTPKLLDKHRHLIQNCLESYFDEPTTKDSIDRRIRNAIRLLAEADHQISDAVGLGMTVAAIEAILGKRGDNISATLAIRIAVLLEPDVQQRGLAEEFVKDLYDTRSRVLHGESVEASTVVRREGRLLAAASLIGLVERRAFLHAAGFDPETPDQLFDDLRRSQYTPGQAMGVMESRARDLWRTRR